MSGDMGVYVLAVLAFHASTCVFGFVIGNEKGRPGMGLALAMMFSVFGLIVLACLDSDRRAAEDRAFMARELSALRGVPDPRMDGVQQNTADQVVLLDQMNTQLERVARNTEATARLVAIMARNVESADG